MSETPKRKKPTKAEIAARDEAAAHAGSAAAPQAEGNGFDAIVGQAQATTGLRQAIQRGRLPHALLLHGPTGIGKATCAGVLAQALNCAPSDFADACGVCASCQKVSRGLHPDVLWVEPMKGIIRLGQVSQRKQKGVEGSPPHEPIVSWVGYRPYEGQRRVVVIDDAHAMNPSAQNALLKTLEEPPPSSTLVLVTSSPGALLPTIRSRCQDLRLQPLPLSLMRQHLEQVCGMTAEEARLRTSLAPGSLGRAMSLDLDQYDALRDVAEAAVHDAILGGAALLASAETLLAAGSGERKIDQASSAMAAVQDILRDLLVLAEGDGHQLVINLDRIEEWSPWAAKLEADSVVKALGAAQRAADRLNSPMQPNARLTIEEALVGVGSALRQAAR